jgi:hypothetical protein
MYQNMVEHQIDLGHEGQVNQEFLVE